jgi:hypothetical protein
MKAYAFGLALLGVMLASLVGAYSMWSETLTISGTVNTGEVKVVIANYTCSDLGADPQIPDSNFSNIEGKDVASCEVTPITEDGNIVGLQITISNAYPGYEAVVTATIENAGTVPVKLLSSTIDNPYSDYVGVSLSHPEDTQLHPGDTQDYQVTIDVYQSASENSSYTFEITLVFAQWNEVPSASPG